MKEEEKKDIFWIRKRWFLQWIKRFTGSEPEDGRFDVMKTLSVWGKKVDGDRNNKGVLSNHGCDAENKVD